MPTVPSDLVLLLTAVDYISFVARTFLRFCPRGHISHTKEGNILARRCAADLVFLT